MHKPGMVSIWFLIGLLLTVYGLIITAVSFYQYFVPPATPPVRSELHAAIWWGAYTGYGLLLLLALPPGQNRMICIQKHEN